MVFHTSRLKPACGSTKNGINKRGRPERSPRIALSLPADDMACLVWWAAKKGVPVASVLRNAVWAYLQVVRAEFEREL